MMFNIFHQLLKEVVEDIYKLQWLKNIVEAKFKGVYVKTETTKLLH